MNPLQQQQTVKKMQAAMQDPMQQMGSNTATIAPIQQQVTVPQQPMQPQPSFDIPKMTMQAPPQAAFPPSKGGAGIGKSPATPAMVQNAIQLLQGKLNKDDVDIIGRFAQAVETGKGKKDLGIVGHVMQSLTENVFGKKAANWSNVQIKNAFDQILPSVLGPEYQ